jgi:hypothetical protein
MSFQRAFKQICWSTVAAIALTSGLWMLPIAPAQAEAWWDRIFSSSRPPDPPIPRGRRPAGGFCAIAPNGTDPDIALPVTSDRPSLFWRGNVETVELWQAEGRVPLEQIDLTTHTVDSLRSVQLAPDQTLYQLTLDVELQPEQHYEWRIYRTGVTEPFIFPFTVMTMDQQTQIQQDLRGVEGTGETAVIQRANYFANQQLWHEFWREVFTVEQPSDPLKQIMSYSTAYFCPQINVAESLAPGNRRSPTGQFYRDFPLNGSAGQAIEVYLSSNEFEPSLVLLNSEGEILTEAVAEDSQAKLVTALPEAGTYTIRVTSESPQTGTYRFRVITLP